MNGSSLTISSRWFQPAVFALFVAVIACRASVSSPESGRELCTGYAEWTTSAYVLPYPVGKTYTVLQANCSPTGDGHRGFNRYGYDFNLAIGTAFVAARAGTVVDVEQSHFDGDIAPTLLDNYIAILHDDKTVGLYGHLTHNGARVKVGDVVRQGDTIGFSGNTGNTNNIPHLHFSLQACDPVTGGSAGCPSIPSTFRNTAPNPTGLQTGHSYTATPW